MALLSKGLSVAQWIERPPGVREVIGSNPVGDSRFFLCPTLVKFWLSHLSHSFTELKKNHELSLFHTLRLLFCSRFQCNAIQTESNAKWKMLQPCTSLDGACRRCTTDCSHTVARENIGRQRKQVRFSVVQFYLDFERLKNMPRS